MRKIFVLFFFVLCSCSTTVRYQTRLINQVGSLVSCGGEAVGNDPILLNTIGERIQEKNSKCVAQAKAYGYVAIPEELDDTEKIYTPEEARRLYMKLLAIQTDPSQKI